MESNALNKLEDLFNYIPQVQIDDGVFKYIQIEVQDTDSKEKIIFVRGYNKYEYHAENFKHFKQELNELKKSNSLKLKSGVSISELSMRCPGGGRIEHKASEKSIFIYGYSQSYGQCSHNLTKKILKEKYSDYSDEKITWSNEGY